jgi:predicted MPP superfamily phosphohydrolase
MIFRFLIFIAIWLLVDLYVFQAVKTAYTGPKAVYIHYAYWAFDILLMLILIYVGATGKMAGGPPKGGSYLMGLAILSLAPKIIVMPFLLIEDIVRLLQGGYVGVQKLRNAVGSEGLSYWPRRKFVSQIALGVAAIPFVGTAWGMIKGKYEYRVHKIKIAFKDLPEAFHGFKITQLSDIHSGSFDNPQAVKHGIDMANAQKSDLIVFTGDLVNNVATEMNDWIDHFSQLSAPMGKFSILGNHDYGDYVQWPSEEAKQSNFEALKHVHKQIGFRLLLNESVHIEKDGQKIALLGVENWGKRGFVKHGDLDKAISNIGDEEFKILLSHDPSHWEEKTVPHQKHIHLTMAGHTHGMQFGIEIPGIKWSPVKYIYKQWAGLYEKAGQYIYVNRGFGFLGFPGRVGILPEITVIELVKKNA